MNDNNIFYVPIKSVNLAHYFMKGCLCPAKYLPNRNNDIQDKFENYILLSDAKFTDETNCCLEIVLDDNFESAIKISDNFYLLGKPIPISRVKRIVFEDEKQKKITSFNVTSGAAFLPENLIEINFPDTKINSRQLDNCKYSPSNIDWSEKLELFDRLMGGFAILGIAGTDAQNYPLNYFNALGLLNVLIDKELKSQQIPVTNNYDWAIIGTDKYITLRNTIYNRITSETVESFAKKDNIRLEKNNGKFVIDKIDQKTNTYLVAILASYGDGARMKVDTFISDFVFDKFSNRKEGIGLMFGINKGYEAFRNQYKTQNFEVDIKFKMDSQLDYYTVESIYQFAFNRKKENGKFEYIDSWCIKQKSSQPLNGYEVYRILDKTIVYKKKEETVSYDSFQRLFQNISWNNIYEKIVIEISKYIPPFSNTNKNEGVQYFASVLESDFKEYAQIIYNQSVEHSERNLKSSLLEIQKLNNIIQEQNNTILELEGRLKDKDKNKNEEVTSLLDKTDVNKIREENQPTITDPINDNTKDKIVKDEAKDQALFDVVRELPKAVVKSIDSRRIELGSFKIGKLKVLARELKISNLNKFKDNVEDINKLIDIIMQTEAKH